jgi:putative flippase GtrA
MTLEPVDLAPRRAKWLEIVLFLLTGGVAALVNVVSRFLLNPLLGFVPAVIVAYMIGMLVAYVLFRAVVFGKSGRSVTNETTRFVIVNIVALSVVTAVSWMLARIVFPAIGFTSHAEDVAHVIGVCVPAITSYIGHSRYTFRR